MFAKLFDTSLGQVVAMRGTSDEDHPEIRFYAQPEGFGVCSVAFGYLKDGDERADAGFLLVDEVMALQALEIIHQNAGCGLTILG